MAGVVVLERIKHPKNSRLYLERRRNSRFWQARCYFARRCRLVSTKTKDLAAAFTRAEAWYYKLQRDELRGVDQSVQKLIKNAKQRAKRAGLPFSLRPSDIQVPEICPVLGIPLFRTPVKPSEHSPTIDRIDNSKGYEPGNIVVVSYRANRLKSDATLLELNRLAAFYTGISARLLGKWAEFVVPRPEILNPERPQIELGGRDRCVTEQPTEAVDIAPTADVAGSKLVAEQMWVDPHAESSLGGNAHDISESISVH